MAKFFSAAHNSDSSATKVIIFGFYIDIVHTYVHRKFCKNSFIIGRVPSDWKRYPFFLTHPVCTICFNFFSLFAAFRREQSLSKYVHFASSAYCGLYIQIYIYKLCILYIIFGLYIYIYKCFCNIQYTYTNGLDIQTVCIFPVCIFFAKKISKNQVILTNSRQYFKEIFFSWYNWTIKTVFFVFTYQQKHNKCVSKLLKK